jgi:hypothetical protein
LLSRRGMLQLPLSWLSEHVGIRPSFRRKRLFTVSTSETEQGRGPHLSSPLYYKKPQISLPSPLPSSSISTYYLQFVNILLPCRTFKTLSSSEVKLFIYPFKRSKLTSLASVAGHTLANALVPLLPTTHRILVVDASDYAYWPIAGLRAAVKPG